MGSKKFTLKKIPLLIPLLETVASLSEKVTKRLLPPWVPLPSCAHQKERADIRVMLSFPPSKPPR